MGKRSTFDVRRSTSKEEASGDEVFDLEDRLLKYAARIVRLVDNLPTTRAGNHVAGQLLRSGTSPLPNHGEAQAAESRADFIHKLGICHKELRESRRWLRLIRRVPLIKSPSKLDPLIDETTALIKIFWSSIRTARENASSSSRLAEDPVIYGATASDLNVERRTSNVERSSSPPRERSATPARTRRRPSPR